MTDKRRIEIICNILDAANGGATKTKIMYIAFLSYAQLNQYLSILVENKLIEYIDRSQTFKTTENRLNFLKMYNEMGKLLQTTNKNNSLN